MCTKHQKESGCRAATREPRAECKLKHASTRAVEQKPTKNELPFGG